MNKQATLLQKVNKNTGLKEWALVSVDDHSKVLRWFGVKKPSEQQVAVEEHRINYFKSLRKAVLRKLI